MVLRLVRRSVALGIAAVLAFAGIASAHDTRGFDGITMRVGWLNEPTYAGSVNAVQLSITKAGAPITDAKLNVVVIFGKQSSPTKSASLTMNASDETPGEYTAPIVPTRPGQYTFHFSGTAAGHKIDEFFQSSETTFDDVSDPTVGEFPAKDPTTGQLASRLDAAEKKTKSANTMATVAIALTVVALAIAGIANIRKRG